MSGDLREDGVSQIRERLVAGVVLWNSEAKEVSSRVLAPPAFHSNLTAIYIYIYTHVCIVSFSSLTITFKLLSRVPMGSQRLSTTL